MCIWPGGRSRLSSRVTRADPSARATRQVYGALAVGFVLFAVYGSLVPFRLRPFPIALAWAQFETAMRALPSRRISRSDVLANVLLFVPIGFTLMGAVLDRRFPLRSLLGAASSVMLFAFSLSLAVEFLQTFALRRVPSNLDVAAQAFGALAGIVAWVLAGPRLSVWLWETWSSVGRHRLLRVLSAYAAAWIFVSLAPFDITVDMGELGARVRAGKIAIAPFAAPIGVPVARQAWDVFAEMVSAVPLGVLMFSAIARYRGAIAAFAAGAALVIGVEFAQIFLLSHSANTTDALAGCLGVAAGVWVATRVSPVVFGPARVGQVAWWASAGLCVWCFVLVAYHWMPYDFVVDPRAIRTELAQMSFIPFAAYTRSAYLNGLNDVLVKIALSMPLGLGAAWASRAQPSTATLIGWMLFAVVVFGTIEAGQLFLPTRVADPTDVLVGVGGTYAGLLLGRWVRAGLESGLSTTE